jgi:DNA-binding beta-propeller fold protein YncE
MAQHRFLLLATMAALLCILAGTAQAEYVYEAWRGGDFGYPSWVAVNPTDGSCWVADSEDGCVVHLARNGPELSRIWGISGPLSVNPADGSCWVADGPNGQVVHLGKDGAELWRGGSFSQPQSVSVNPTDGSCWVCDDLPGNDEVVHLSADGSELWRGGSFRLAYRVAVDASDGSCWVADRWGDEVVHLAEDGAELWRGDDFAGPQSLSVSPTDGSCWVADEWADEVIRLAADGSELWRRGGFENPASVSVNPTDASCWVADRYDDTVVHLAEDGTELWRGEGFDWPECVSVNASDGSCWVGERYSHQVVHLVVYTSPPVFDDVQPGFWAFEEIMGCYEADIVGGYGTTCYEPTFAVSRDQMAVFISRSICTPTGEAGMADYVPPDNPTFSDVPTDYWAYKYIEYCVANDVVQGLDSVTYGPANIVTRDQMAVFISRAATGCDDSVPEGPAEASFGDVPTDHWAYKHVEYCVAQSIAGGYGDGLYHPEYPVTRDQMAVFICRAFDLPT